LKAVKRLKVEKLEATIATGGREREKEGAEGCTD